MRKVVLIVALCFCLVGCTREADLIGTWTSQDGSIYIFNEDGTCEKRTNIDKYSCTYSKENGVVDIQLSNGLKESGQINPDRIIIGSDMYKKES